MKQMKTLETVHKAPLAANTLPRTHTSEKRFTRTRHSNPTTILLLSHKLFYEFSNKSGRLLAKTLRSEQAINRVHSIKDSTGKAQTDPAVIADEFRKYYYALYNLPCTDEERHPHMIRTSQIQEFLEKYSPPALSPGDASSLEGPLTKLEVKQALKQTKTRKEPRSDGLPSQYYKSFADILIPHFLKAFNTLTSPTTPPCTNAPSTYHRYRNPAKTHQYNPTIGPYPY